MKKLFSLASASLVIWLLCTTVGGCGMGDEQSCVLPAVEMRFSLTQLNGEVLVFNTTDSVKVYYVGPNNQKTNVLLSYATQYGLFFSQQMPYISAQSNIRTFYLEATKNGQFYADTIGLYVNPAVSGGCSVYSYDSVTFNGKLLSPVLRDNVERFMFTLRK